MRWRGRGHPATRARVGAPVRSTDRPRAAPAAVRPRGVGAGGQPRGTGRPPGRAGLAGLRAADPPRTRSRCACPGCGQPSRMQGWSPARRRSAPGAVRTSCGPIPSRSTSIASMPACPADRAGGPAGSPAAARAAPRRAGRAGRPHRGAPDPGTAGRAAHDRPVPQRPGRPGPGGLPGSSASGWPTTSASIRVRDCRSWSWRFSATNQSWPDPPRPGGERIAVTVPAVPRELPPEVRGFTGGRRAIDELDQVLAHAAASSAMAIAVVSGTGGVGKTNNGLGCSVHMYRSSGAGSR